MRSSSSSVHGVPSFSALAKEIALLRVCAPLTKLPADDPDTHRKPGAVATLYPDFCNRRRPHPSLDGATPDRAYFTQLPLGLAA